MPEFNFGNIPDADIEAQKTQRPKFNFGDIPNAISYSPDRDFLTDAINTMGVGGLDAIQMVAKAFTASGIKDMRSVIKGVDDIKLRATWDDPSQQYLESSLRRTVLDGIRSFSSSMGARLGGMAAGALVGGVPGAFVGGVIAGAPVYGLAAYHDFTEEAKAAGIPESAFKDEAVMAAFAEGGLELASDLIFMKIFGFIGAKPGVKAFLKKPLTQKFFKGFLGKYLLTAGEEIPTEMAQEWAGMKLREKAGIQLDMSASEAMRQVIGPTAVSSALFALSGMGGQGIKNKVSQAKENARKHSVAIPSELEISREVTIEDLGAINDEVAQPRSESFDQMWQDNFSDIHKVRSSEEGRLEVLKSLEKMEIEGVMDDQQQEGEQLVGKMATSLESERKRKLYEDLFQSGAITKEDVHAVRSTAIGKRFLMNQLAGLDERGKREAAELENILDQIREGDETFESKQDELIAGLEKIGGVREDIMGEVEEAPVEAQPDFGEIPTVAPTMEAEVEQGEIENIKKATDISNDKVNLRKELNDTKSVLNKSMKGKFKDAIYDFENKRLISQDGNYSLQWRLRNDPNSPASYKNQQTNRGTVAILEHKTKKPITDDFAKIVKANGGLRAEGDLAGDVRALPLFVRNQKGLTPDAMAEKLIEAGYPIESTADLLTKVRDRAEHVTEATFETQEQQEESRLEGVPVEGVKASDLKKGDMFETPDDQYSVIEKTGDKVVIKDGIQRTLKPGETVDIIGGKEGILEGEQPTTAKVEGAKHEQIVSPELLGQAKAPKGKIKAKGPVSPIEGTQGVGMFKTETGEKQQDVFDEPVPTTKHGIALKKKFDIVSSKLKGAAKTVVVDDIDGLPEDISKIAKERGGKARGVYDKKTKTVYIVASNLENTDQAISTFIHEQVGHHSIKEMLGDQYSATMKEIQKAVGIDEVRRSIPKAYHSLSNERQTEEYLSRLASKMNAAGKLTGQEKTVWDRFVQFIKESLGLSTTNAAEDLIIKSYKYMLKGDDKITAQRESGKELEFDEPFDPFAEKTLIEEAKKFKSADEFVGSKDVVYHGTNQEFGEFDTKKIGSQSDDGIFGRGFYFAPNKAMAETAPRGAKAKIVKEVVLDLKNPLDIAKFKTKKGLANYLGMSEDSLTEGSLGIFRPLNSLIRQFTSHVKEKGHDSVYVNRGGKGDEIVAFYPSQIKTKSQLTEIWNKANKAESDQSGKELEFEEPFEKESKFKNFKPIDTIAKAVEPAKLVEKKHGPQVYSDVMEMVGKPTAEVDRVSKMRGIDDVDTVIGTLEGTLDHEYTQKDLDNYQITRQQSKFEEGQAEYARAKSELPDGLKSGEFIEKVKRVTKQITDHTHKVLVDLQKKMLGDEAQLELFDSYLGYVEEYFYGRYKDTPALRERIHQAQKSARAHFTTTKRFMKSKAFDTYADARAAGLELKDANPITNALSELAAVEQLSANHDLKQKLFEGGEDLYIQKTKDGKGAKEGWVQIGEDGDPVWDGVYAEPDLARLINNMLSTNKVVSSKPLNTLRRINGLARAVKFLGSFYHISMVEVKVALADSGYLGFLNPARLIESGKHAAASSKKMLKKIESDPFIKQVYTEYVTLLGTPIGAKTGYELELSTIRNMEKFLSDKGLLRAKKTKAGRALFAIPSIPVKFVNWMFRNYIPTLKFAKYMQHVGLQEKKLGRELTKPEKLNVIKEGQNFYGEMNEKMLGRDSTTTSLLRLIFMAPGFAEGNYRTTIKSLVQWRGANAAHRSRANIINSLIITSTLATIGTLILKGKPPEPPEKMEDVRDLFKIDTGQVDAKGKKVMIDLLSYDKDYYEIFGKMLFGPRKEIPASVFKRLGGMKAPLVTLVRDSIALFEGRALVDWKGDRVFYHTDPFFTKLLKVANHITAEMEPIAWSTYKQSRQRSSNAISSFVESMAGVRKTYTEADRREMEAFRKLYDLKDKREDRYRALSEDKNPAKLVKAFNNEVLKITRNDDIPANVKIQMRGLLIDIEKYIGYSISRLMSQKTTPMQRRRIYKILTKFRVGPASYGRYLNNYRKWGR